MGRIREKKKGKDKVEPVKTQTLSHIAFSLRYLTSNKNFGFGYFKTDFRNSHTAYEAFVDRMRELCCINIADAHAIGKPAGSEPIPYKNLSESMRQVCDSTEIVSRDSSLTVFRFQQNNYRMICKQDVNHSNLLHVIAFDFNYTAYDHGS